MSVGDSRRWPESERRSGQVMVNWFCHVGKALRNNVLG